MKNLITAVLLLGAGSAQAALVTFNFAGVFTSNTSVFNAGDTYSGSYTLETTAEQLSHPDPSIDIQSHAIDPTFAGTGWDLTIASSIVGDISLSGIRGGINIGSDAYYGDRYVVQLYDYVSQPFEDITLGWFYIELNDSRLNGADMLTSVSLDTLPNVSLAEQTQGRLNMIGDSNCNNCSHNLTSLTITTVPVPAAVWLFVSGLGMLGWIRRR